MTGRVTVEEYETATLRDRFPRWRRLPTDIQARLLRGCDPTRRHTAPNTTCVELHRRIVDGLDKSQPRRPPIELIALGKGGAQPTESDRSLNDHVADVGVIGYDDSGTSIFATAIVSNDEANVDVGSGEALREVAAIAGGINGANRYFLNHALFAQPIEKNPSVTVVVTVQLIFDSGTQ